METLELNSFGDNENKWRLVLTGLKPDNVGEIYNREFDRWRVFHSDSRRLDGKEISLNEFMLMYIGNGFEGMEVNKFEVSDESEGFPLKEETFIKEQIIKYEYILKDTEGSVLDRTVYLKCELFLGYLRERLSEINGASIIKITNNRENKIWDGQEDRVLKLNQIALIFSYENKTIAESNKKDIAEEYGWNSKTSGHKLYQYFNQFRITTNRTGDPGSKVKLRNKIKLIESVLEYLSESAYKKAKKEMDYLSERLSRQY